ncbi:MAG TPA: hypothetical protein V6C86_05035 [Oculatellaceae cyanobacterium]
MTTSPNREKSTAYWPKSLMRQDFIAAGLILTGMFGFLCYWMRVYFTDRYLPGWDLPGQVVTVMRMMPQLGHLHYSFYDPGFFLGYGVDLFYAPGFHILTAIIANLLASVSKDPALLACHLGLVLGCSALPFSMWYFLRPLAQEMKQGRRLSTSEATVLALAISASSFWFLNHDSHFFGIGYGSVMGIGLYTQCAGWHLLFWHSGAVARLILTGKRKYEIWATVFYFSLFLTHSLTALFSLGLTILVTLWYQKFAWRMLRVHVIALAITAFWTLPATALTKTYGVLSEIGGRGDIFELVFRYPLFLLWRHIDGCLHGHFKLVDLNPITFSICMIAYVSLKTIRRTPICVVYYLAVFIAMFFGLSPFLAKCIQATIHFYRFLGDIFLLLAGLVSLVPVGVVLSFPEKTAGTAKRISTAFFVLLFLSCIVSTTRFPFEERKKTIDRLGLTPDHQQNVIDYFKPLAQKGRVFFEMFENENTYDFLPAHYLESNLFEQTGFEPVNGLFLESVNSYRLPVTAANNLGSHTWATSQIFGNDKDSSPERALEQLRDFGVTHMVCGGDDDLYKHLKNRVIAPIEYIGPYAICQIAKLPTERVKKIDAKKLLVGYIDTVGNLPFEYVEAYFYTNATLYQNFELVDFTNKKVPPGVTLILENTIQTTDVVKSPPFEDINDAIKAKIVGLAYTRYDVIDHHSVWYQDNPEYDTYRRICDYLNQQEVMGKLMTLKKDVVNTQSKWVGSSNKPELKWSNEFQTFTISNCEPGQILKVNYSYLPFWASKNARIFEGTYGQIFVFPASTQVQVDYSLWNWPYYWIGVLISFTGLGAFSLYFVRWPKSGVSAAAGKRVKEVVAR